MKGILSILGPVIFTKDHQFPTSNISYRRIRRYLQVNSIFNLIIHVWVWLIMTFVVCWGVQCIEADQHVNNKFWNFVPALLVLHVLSFVLLVPFERSFILRNKTWNNYITNVWVKDMLILKCDQKLRNNYPNLHARK